MSVGCSDNSTECLLRLLIETTANNTSPWEPRNFGFTVAIGVAAFIISIVTVFQALFASGPGRIKGSEDAIGSFSKLTKGRISWLEFAWRTTAQVPLITLEDLQRNLENQNLAAFKHGTNFPAEAGGTSTGASWLHLLKCVGLDRDVEIHFKSSLRPCRTDHLPTDVQVPPSTMQLRCLAILTGIADISMKYQQSSDRFLMLGDKSQVPLREHPVLGTLAAYENYQSQAFCTKHSVLPPKYKKPYASFGRCTRHALDLAQGRLSVTSGANENFELVDVVSQGCQTNMYMWSPMMLSDQRSICRPDPQGCSTNKYARALALSIARSDYEIRPFPWLKSQMKEAAKFLFEKCSCYVQSHETLLRTIKPILSEHQESYKGRDVIKDMAFENAGTWATGSSLKYIGITGTFDKDFYIDICLLIMTFQARLTSVQGFTNYDRVILYLDSHKTSSDVVREPWYILKHIDILLSRKWTRSVLAIDCLHRKWISASAQDIVPPSPLQWSNYTINPDGTMTSAPVSPKTQTVMSWDPASEGSKFDLQQYMKEDEADFRKWFVQIGTSEEEQLAVELLLMLRGLMMAMLLEAGPDTSPLFEAGFEDRMVKMI